MAYDIKIIGPIDAILFKDLTDAVEDSTKNKITMLLNSPGGDATEAVAIAEYMRVCGREFHITAMGQVESAAVLILASGAKRVMTRECCVMVHESSGKIKGSVTEMEKALGSFRDAEEQWNRLMASMTKASANYWASLHQETTYLTAEECLELGLIDEVI